MKLLLVFLCLYALPALASVETRLTATSDYVLHGISQTDQKPALQIGVEKQSTNGSYFGMWSSNVDFSEQTKLEMNYYLGYQWPINALTNLDIGAVQIQYLNRDLKDLGHHTEGYIKLTYNQNTHYKLVCSSDFEGFNPRGGIKGKHCMAQFNYQFMPVRSFYHIDFEVDYSRSFDKQNQGKQYYLHSGVYLSRVFGCCEYIVSFENTWFNSSVEKLASHVTLQMNYQF